MTIPGTHSTIMSRHITIGILQGSQAFIYPRLDAVNRCHAAMPQTDVKNIQWFCPQVLSHLQILMESDAISRAIAPVDIPVSGTFLYRTDGAFPPECIVG